jgi:hypothetical protein
MARKSTPPVRASAAGPAGDDLWERFLARVREDKVALYMTLAAGKLLATDGDTLRIGIDNEAMRRELNRKDTLSRLRAIACEVSGRDVTVDVGPLPQEHAGDTPLAQARRKTEEGLTDPLVQAAVDIFGAEVRGVRDRRT